VERDLARTWQVSLGLVGHDWHEPERDRSTVGGSLRIANEDRAGLRLAQAGLLWTGVYRRVEFDGEINGRMGPVRLRPRLRFGWGENLPLQATFPLGGEDGFPGLHIGERRGDREVMLDLLMTYPLKGPFVGRLELGVGRSALGGPVLDRSGWVTGGRLGVGAETPVGPVRFEYGLSERGRGAFFVRLGRWF
jgi:hypothetical protein